MPSLTRPFGTSIENIPTSDLVAAKPVDGISKTSPQKASVISYTLGQNENRIDDSKEQATRPLHRRRRSANAVPTRLSVLPEDEEDSNDESDLARYNIFDSGFPRKVSTERSKSSKRRVQSFDDSLTNNVIYSTSSSLDSTLISCLSSFSSDSTSSSSRANTSSDVLLEEVEPVPFYATSSDNKTAVISSGDWSSDDEELALDSKTLSASPICWTGNFTAQVSPPRTSKSDILVEELNQLLGSGATRRRSYPRLVRRKPVPVRLLQDISREAMISKFSATRPPTPSLLSFTESASKRVHPPRIVRSRYPTDSDALRRNCVERYRLLRAGIPPELPSSQGPKPYLFPRAGDLGQLRSLESTAYVDDWHLGYVDISFIQKTLFAFDMRMRVGSDLWAAEEDEIYRLFGDNKQWEMDWDMRWKIATWLLNQSDDEEDEDSDDDSEHSSA